MGFRRFLSLLSSLTHFFGLSVVIIEEFMKLFSREGVGVVLQDEVVLSLDQGSVGLLRSSDSIARLREIARKLEAYLLVHVSGRFRASSWNSGPLILCLNHRSSGSGDQTQDDCTSLSSRATRSIRVSISSGASLRLLFCSASHSCNFSVMDFLGNEGSGDAEEGKLGKSSSLHCCNSLLLSWNNVGMTSWLSRTRWGMIVGPKVFDRKAALLWTLSTVDSPFLCSGSCSPAGVSRHT